MSAPVATAPVSDVRPLPLPALPSRGEVVRIARLAIMDSCVWTALTLAALPLFAAHVMGLAMDLRPSAVIFFSGMLIYNLDHFADSYEESGSMDLWRGGIGRGALSGLVLCSALTLAGLLWLAPPAVGRVFVGYALVGLLYGLPVFPVRRQGAQGWLRLKDIPGFKAAIVASAICVAAVGLPLAYAGGGLGPLAGPAALFIWVFVVSNAVMCDVGDLRADLASGVPTLPVMLGVRCTRQAVILLNLFLLSLFMWGWASGMVAPHPEVLISASLVVLYVVLVNERTPKQLMSLCLDGCSFVPILLALLIHGQLG